jgi:lipid A 3-O-deacylase
MSRRLVLLAAAAPLALSAPAAAGQEVFAGAYVHAVNTPFTLDTGESGADLELGIRFPRSKALAFIGRPSPYVFGSVNTRGYTDFAGAGLSWKLGKGPVYVRPGIGLVVNDAPRRRDGPHGLRTDLGSPVLFEPEIALGTRLSPAVSVEASWVHISGARLFNSRQNPGIDMIGVRLAYAWR